MSRKILGLDIGMDNLKAVGITAGKSRKIYAAEIVAIPAEGGIQAALEELRARGIECDACVCALHPAVVSLRNMQMPFREERKIRQTIAFELEPLLPYPVEDAVIDFIIATQSEPAWVLAAAAPRKVVREMVQLLEGVYPEAACIDLDGVPLAKKLAANLDECALLVDIGAERSVAVLIAGGRILHVRPFAFGGGTITRAIAEAAGCSFEDAEVRKISGDPAGKGPETERTCDGFAREVKSALDMAATVMPEGTEQVPAKVFIAGGGALFDGIRKGFETAFNTPVEIYDPTAREDFEIGPGVALPWSMRLNGALALALRGTKRGAGLDFRRGEFEPKKYAEKLQRDLKWAALMVLVAVTALLADTGAGYYLDYLKLNRLKAAITEVFKASNPEVAKIVDPVQQLKTRISEAKKISLGSGTPFLALLKEISALVPEKAEFFIANFVYDGEHIEIKAETASFDMAEEIKKSIAASPRFKNISISSATSTRQGGKVEFGLKMDVSK